MDTAVPINGGEPNTSDMAVDLCMKASQDVTDAMNEIRNRTQQIREAVTKSREVFNVDGSEDDAVINNLMDLVQVQSKLCKKKLDEIKAATVFLSRTPEEENNNAATIKIYQNQYQFLMKGFSAAINEYKAVVAERDAILREQTKKRIKLKYTNPDGSTISEDEANRMARDIMMENAPPNALLQTSQDTLHSILETRRDLVRMEASIKELQQMFNDLAVILNEQGEVMDQIKGNVEKSIQYVEKGREALKDAKKYQKSSKKKMCYVIIAVFVIFLVILAPTLGATIPTIKK